MGSSEDIKALEHEAKKFHPPHDCIFCKYILVVSVLLFFMALFLFLFMNQRGNAKRIIPVEQISSPMPLTRDASSALLNDLRATAAAKGARSSSAKNDPDEPEMLHDKPIPVPKASLKNQ